MTHSALMHPTRRAACMAATLALACCLAGCGTQDNTDATENEESEAAEETDFGSFDGSVFTVDDVFGTTYTAAEGAAAEFADDLQFVAVRTPETIQAGENFSWDYLFCSHSTISYYMVFTEGIVTAQNAGDCLYYNEEWDTIPGIDTVVVDARSAYAAVCEFAEENGEPAARNMFAYLQIFYSQDEMEEDQSAYAYEAEAGKWYFEFNIDETEDEDPLLMKSEDTLEAEAEAAEEAGALAPFFAYSVDIATGAVEKVC